MSGCQDYMNDSLVSQHRQARMHEGATERALRAMRAEQRSDRDQMKELSQTVGSITRPSRFGHAWSSLITALTSFLG